MAIERKNSDPFKTILNALKELEGVEGRVGWFPSARYESGISVANVVALNEFGHGNTPPRPFVRPTIASKGGEWRDLALSASRQTLQGKISAYEAMNKLTQKAENDIKQSILEVFDPPLSPVTIELRAMKKRNPNLRVTGATVGEAARRVKEAGYQTPSVNTKPLIDSGLMIATLTHVVEIA